MMIASVAWLARLVGLAPSPALLETCARLVSVLAGTLLLIPLHRLARRLLGEEGAWIAVLLAAFHPRLVQYSGAALTEMPFGLLLLTGLAALAAACGEGASAARRATLEAGAGATLGLAYLVRPEGLILGGVLWLWRWLARPGPAASRAGPAFLLGAALVALPYLNHVHGQLGYASIGLKGSYNFWREFKSEYAQVYPAPKVLAQRASESEELAAPLPPERIHVTGFVFRRPGIVLAHVVRNLSVILVSSIPVALYHVYLVLAILGASRVPPGPWWIVGVPLLALPLLYAPISADRRFFVPAIPLLLVFTSRGLETARTWLEQRGVAQATAVARAGLAGLVLFGLLYSILRVGPLDDAPEHRAAGQWLANHWQKISAAHPPQGSNHGRPVVMSRKPWVAFYSGGLIAELPGGSLAEVLNRAREKQADVLVIDERWIRATRRELLPLLDPAQAPPRLAVLHPIDSPRRIILYDLRAVR